MPLYIGPPGGRGSLIEDAEVVGFLDRLNFKIPPVGRTCIPLPVVGEVCLPVIEIPLGKVLTPLVWRVVGLLNSVAGLVNEIPTPAAIWGWVSGSLEGLLATMSEKLRVSLTWTLQGLLSGVREALAGLVRLSGETLGVLQWNITQLRDFGFWLAGEPTPEERFTFGGLVSNTFETVVDRVIKPIAGGLTGGLERSNSTPDDLGSVPAHILSVKDQVGPRPTVEVAPAGPRLVPIAAALEEIEGLPVPPLTELEGGVATPLEELLIEPSPVPEDEQEPEYEEGEPL